MHSTCRKSACLKLSTPNKKTRFGGFERTQQHRADTAIATKGTSVKWSCAATVHCRGGGATVGDVSWNRRLDRRDRPCRRSLPPAPAASRGRRRAASSPTSRRDRARSRRRRRRAGSGASSTGRGDVATTEEAPSWTSSAARRRRRDVRPPRPLRPSETPTGGLTTRAVKTTSLDRQQRRRQTAGDSRQGRSHACRFPVRRSRNHRHPADRTRPGDLPTSATTLAATDRLLSVKRHLLNTELEAASTHKSAKTKVPKHCFFVPRDLDRCLLTPKQMGYQDSWWNISVSCLVILAAAVFEISCRKNRQTPVKTKYSTSACRSLGDGRAS